VCHLRGAPKLPPPEPNLTPFRFANSDFIFFNIADFPEKKRRKKNKFTISLDVKSISYEKKLKNE
jgi:hypothetical protein